MPLGIERLNARRQQPNSRIVFIKPIPGPTATFAQDFLERIAAICHPIMKANHLSVMSLEEYEPNPEFVGRNFNAGEVIQLVLKAPFTGHWLSFRSVQMVMMHELAHCMQMNHSAAFWKVRNQYAGELKELWSKGYTGDGFWGRGKTFLSDQYENNGAHEPEVLPRSLCGGTFRSSRRKRKRKAGGSQEKRTLSYAERQQRRIAKKFGTNGVALGDDEGTRIKLEDGKKPKGKPRVASSARGRELRAAAALARFGEQNEEVLKKEESQSETNSESEYEVDIKAEAVDSGGARLLDGRGNTMIKVCEDEDTQDVRVKEEMQELEDINNVTQHIDEPRFRTEVEPKMDEAIALGGAPSSSKGQKRNSDYEATESSPLPTSPPRKESPTGKGVSCPICSMLNDSLSSTCIACSHVLNTATPGSWHCQSTACKDSQYVNAADCGRCGVCGARKPEE